MATGETPLLGYAFRYGTFAFYLHTEIVLTDRRLYGASPNTVLGLIPVGTKRLVFPIENIASVGAATRLSVLPLLLALLAFLIGFNGLSTPGLGEGGTIWLVIGVLLALGSPKQAIEVVNSGGGAIRFPVAVFQRSRTIDFANQVSEAIAAVAPRGAPQSAPMVTQPHQDPTAALQELTRLRDQALISAEEFAAKRAEILARL